MHRYLDKWRHLFQHLLLAGLFWQKHRKSYRRQKVLALSEEVNHFDLNEGVTAFDAAILAVSYFNLCGEKVYQEFTQPMGIAAFRHQTLNQLSLLKFDENWYKAIRSELL